MLKGWKTILFSLLVAAVGVLTATDWAQVIPDGPAKGWYLVGIAFLTAWLRVITDTPVFRREIVYNAQNDDDGNGSG